MVKSTNSRNSVIRKSPSGKLFTRPTVKPLGFDEQPLRRRLREDFPRIFVLELGLWDRAERPNDWRGDIIHHLLQQRAASACCSLDERTSAALIVMASPALMTAWMRQMPMAFPYSSSPRVTSARARRKEMSRRQARKNLKG